MAILETELTRSWKDVTTALSLSDGDTYYGQAKSTNIEYRTEESATAPSSNVRGFLLRRDALPAEYEQKSGKYLFARVAIGEVNDKAYLLLDS